MTATTTISGDEKRKLFSRFFELLCRRASTLIANGYDRDVYLFIADRSLPFGKLSKGIPDRWFLDGVTGKGNTRGHRAGLSMKRAQLYKSRKALKDRGLVRDQKVGRCKRYAVALEPVWDLLSTEERVLFAPLLTITDLDWQADDPAEKVYSVDVQQVQSVDPHTEKRSPSRTRTEENAGEASASLTAIPAVSSDREQSVFEEVITSADGKEVARREKRTARAAAHSGSALVEVFAAAAGETFPNMKMMSAPTVIQLARLKRHSKNWDHPDVTFAAFLEWSAQNWRGVYASKLRWVPKLEFTDFPDVEMMLRYLKAFRDSYDRRASQRIRAGLTRRDNLLREFMFKGFSYADAELEADEVLAREKIREGLDKRARDLNAAARRLEMEKQMPEYRLAVARIRSGKDADGVPMKPVALTKHPLKPTFKYANGDGVMPLPPMPVWRDDLHEDHVLSAVPSITKPPLHDHVQAGGQV